nr:hypothetical protein [Candidatus Sigynarchaeota archaeon]
MRGSCRFDLDQEVPRFIPSLHVGFDALPFLVAVVPRHDAEVVVPVQDVDGEILTEHGEPERCFPEACSLNVVCVHPTKQVDIPSSLELVCRDELERLAIDESPACIDEGRVVPARLLIDAPDPSLLPDADIAGSREGVQELDFIAGWRDR